MKILIVMVALLALAAPATASAPARDPRVPGLQKQVRVLKSQVTELGATVKSLEGRMATLEDRNECYEALQEDTNGAFYGAISRIGQRTGLAPLPPVSGSYDDKGACARVGINRGG